MALEWTLVQLEDSWNGSQRTVPATNRKLTSGTDAMQSQIATRRVARSAAAPAARRAVRFRFRLYVAGDAPNSALARINLHAICKSHCAEDFEIEEVNVLREPMRALADRIRMTPTLLKLAPGPVARIVGTLGDQRRLLLSLGLPERGA
jgi:circadian clock protein KaiB